MKSDIIPLIVAVFIFASVAVYCLIDSYIKNRNPPYFPLFGLTLEEAKLLCRIYRTPKWDVYWLCYMIREVSGIQYHPLMYKITHSLGGYDTLTAWLAERGFELGGVDRFDIRKQWIISLLVHNNFHYLLTESTSEV